MVRDLRIRFTKHALEKFEVLKHYDFEVKKELVMKAISNPELIEQRGEQYFAIRTLDKKHALRVVYEKRKGYVVVITFYPVRRERYGI